MLELYKRIRQRREELNMSQEELASKLGYKSRSSINKIEKGQNDIPQSKIKAFADALQTTPAYLMGWNDDSESTKITFGNQFRDLRMKKGLTPKDVADMISVSENVIHRFESNKMFPPLEVLKKISEALEVDYHIFYNGRPVIKNYPDDIVYKVVDLIGLLGYTPIFLGNPIGEKDEHGRDFVTFDGITFENSRSEIKIFISTDEFEIFCKNILALVNTEFNNFLNLQKFYDNVSNKVLARNAQNQTNA